MGNKPAEVTAMPWSQAPRWGLTTAQGLPCGHRWLRGRWPRCSCLEVRACDTAAKVREGEGYPHPWGPGGGLRPWAVSATPHQQFFPRTPFYKRGVHGSYFLLALSLGSLVKEMTLKMWVCVWGWVEGQLQVKQVAEDASTRQAPSQCQAGRPWRRGSGCRSWLETCRETGWALNAFRSAILGRQGSGHEEGVPVCPVSAGCAS